MGAFFNPGLLPRLAQQCRQLANVRHFSLVKSSIDDGLATITMTSSKTRNSLSLSMLSELHSEIGRAHKNPEVRCIAVRAEGPAFSSGHNLKEMTSEEGREYHQTIFRRCNELMHEIVQSPVPVIAVVDGAAFAAGVQLVAICDIAIATEKSTFSTPGSNVGLFCSTPGVPLARAIPRKMSAFMLLTGLPINAEEALRAGLISKLAKDTEQLEKELDAIVDSIRSKPRAVVSLGKKFFYRQVELGLAQALSEGGKVMVDNLAYKDAQEGIKAFKEKRKPVWSHTDEKV